MSEYCRERTEIRELKNPQSNGRGIPHLLGYGFFTVRMEDLKNFNDFAEGEKENLKFFTWWNAISVMDKRTAMSKVFRELAAAPYKTDTINSYIEMARICSHQVTILKKMTDDCS